MIYTNVHDSFTGRGACRIQQDATDIYGLNVVSMPAGLILVSYRSDSACGMPESTYAVLAGSVSAIVTACTQPAKRPPGPYLFSYGQIVAEEAPGNQVQVRSRSRSRGIILTLRELMMLGDNPVYVLELAHRASTNSGSHATAPW